MNKSEWINNNIDMINYFFNNLCNFIHKNDEDFKLNTDEETLFNNLCEFLYNCYIIDKNTIDIKYDNNFEYFDSIYCSDITDLFINMKNIADGFTNDIFKKKNNSYDLTEFIYVNISLNEDYNKTFDESEEEYEEEY